MSKTETQSEALRLARLLESGCWLPVGHGDPIDEAAAELRRLDAENKALRDVLEAVDMDAIGIGGGENAISNATRAKVEALLEKIRAPQVVPAEDVLKGVRRYHFVQRSKFGPWTEVEQKVAGSVAFVKENDLSPQAAAKTGDAA